MQRPICFTLIPILFLVCHANAQDLEISLNLAKNENETVATIEYEETFEVVLKNTSKSMYQLPDENSSTGIASLSFTIRDPETGKTYSVHRKLDKEFSAEPVTLAAGKSLSIFVGFSYDQWNSLKWRDLPTPNIGKNLEIVAKYKVPPSGCKTETWVGEAESEPLLFNFVFQRANQPQQYLWNGFTEAALELMKSSPDLINATDEDSRTPIHVAARFNQTEVVEWLIANNANVNVKAYNGFTPLYMAHMSANPRIYKMLLEAGADPNSKDAFGQTPLQTVVSRLAAPEQLNNAKHLEKWDRILDVFIDHGVQLDLISAIQLGKEDLVKQMLNDSPDILDRYLGNQRPLRTAAQYGRFETAKFLIESFPEKIDVDNFAGENGYPISKSALQHYEVLELLIQHGADLERRITWQGPRTGIWLVGDNATLLHFAARDGTPDTIKLLLSNGVDPFATSRTDSREEIGQTALEVATIFGNTQNFLTLINHPTFQLNRSEAKQKIVEKCFLQVCRGVTTTKSDQARVRILKALLENGADKIVQSDKQKYVQMVTRGINARQDIEDGTKDVVQLLLDAGGELDLFSAVAIQNNEAIDQLLEADPLLAEARRADGYPAAHFAVSRGDLELVKKFLDAGCDLELKNQSKNSGHFAGRMIHVAAFWHQPKVAKLLIEAGANVNSIAKLETTPLHVAARTGSYEVARLLLENGAKLHARDVHGRSPLDMATAPKVKQLLTDWK